MKITARKDVPCVSQTLEWKGLFEAHFMSGKEINEKYPILNKLWTFVDDGGILTINNRSYSTIYRVSTGCYSDPWYRELKHEDPLYENSEEIAYVTTVEGNAVVLKFQKTKL